MSGSYWHDNSDVRDHNSYPAHHTYAYSREREIDIANATALYKSVKGKTMEKLAPTIVVRGCNDTTPTILVVGRDDTAPTIVVRGSEDTTVDVGECKQRTDK